MDIKEFLKDLISGETKTPTGGNQNLLQKVLDYEKSKKRIWMQIGERYYDDHHDIEFKRRTAASKNGTSTIKYLPNNKWMDNKFSWLVDQKIDYLLSKPLDIKCDNEEHSNVLKDVFTFNLQAKLKEIGEDAIISGIAFLYVYVKNNEVKFKRLQPDQVLPIWADDEKEELRSFIRFYDEKEEHEGKEKMIKYIEHYKADAIYFYKYDKEQNDFKQIGVKPYITIDGQNYHWKDGKIPLVVFRPNKREQPLIKRIKGLQDGINEILSNFGDTTQEDVRNSILVLKNYAGEDLGEFRKNLALFGAVKVETEDGVQGGVEVLKIEINPENYEAILRILKRAIVENGRGFDVKDERLGNALNTMHLKAMYSQLDSYADGMELQFQVALQEMIKFINLANNTDIKADFIFNRDMIINEAEMIQNCRNSVGIISTETIIANHPMVKNYKAEIERLKKERAELFKDEYLGTGDVEDES